MASFLRAEKLGGNLIKKFIILVEKFKQNDIEHLTTELKKVRLREELEMKLKEGEEKLKKKERDFEEVIAAYQNPFFTISGRARRCLCRNNWQLKSR